MRQAVAFNEVVVKPAVAFGWPHQPIRRFRQLPFSKTASPAAQMLTREGLAVSKSRLTKFIGAGGFMLQITGCCKDTTPLPIQMATPEAVQAVLRYICRASEAGDGHERMPR